MPHILHFTHILPQIIISCPQYGYIVATIEFFLTMSCLGLRTDQTGSQTLTQQHNIWIIFKIQHCVSASTKISKKRQIQAVPLILQLGTLLVVFITHTYNYGCE